MNNFPFILFIIFVLVEVAVLVEEGQEGLFLEPVGQSFIIIIPILQAEIILFWRPLLVGEEEVVGQSFLQEVVDYA